MASQLLSYVPALQLALIKQATLMQTQPNLYMVDHGPCSANAGQK